MLHALPPITLLTSVRIADPAENTVAINTGKNDIVQIEFSEHSTPRRYEKPECNRIVAMGLCHSELFIVQALKQDKDSRMIVKEKDLSRISYKSIKDAC